MNRRRLAVAAAVGAALAPSRLRAQNDDATCSYTAAMGAINMMVNWALREASWQETGASPTDFVDPQWQVDVLAPYAVAQAAQQVIGKIEPPAAFRSAHFLYAQGVDELVLAQTAMEQGILTSDSTLVDEAVAHTNRATRLIDQSANALPT